MKSNTSLVFFISAIAAIGGLLIGYDTAVISGAIGDLTTYFDLDDTGQGQAAGSALIGCIAGAAIAGKMSDALGRKVSLLIASFLFLVSAIGSAIPESFAVFLSFRIIGGIGVGIAGIVSTMYIGEVAPPEKRGFFISFYQMAVVIGIFGVYFVNYEIAEYGKSLGEDWMVESGWRWMIGSESLVALLYFVLLFFVPKSPRWLMEKGEEEEARGVLSKVVLDKVDQVIAEIKESISSSEKGDFFYFKRPGMMLALFVGIALSVFQQLVGINSVLYYAPKIFEQMGYSSGDSYMQTVIVGGVNFLFTIFAIYTIDRVGRKPLLLYGSIIMGVCMLLLGFNVMSGDLSVTTLLYMLGFIAAFAISWGPVVWVMIAEIYPLKIKGIAMSIAILAQYVANYTVTSTFPILENVGGDDMNKSVPYFVYGVFALISFFVIKAYAPETKGKTLEEMEEVFAKR